MPKSELLMDRSELDAEWKKQRKELEDKRDTEGLTEQEEAYLWLAIFYTMEPADGE